MGHEMSLLMGPEPLEGPEMSLLMGPEISPSGVLKLAGVQGPP